MVFLEVHFYLGGMGGGCPSDVQISKKLFRWDGWEASPSSISARAGTARQTLPLFPRVSSWLAKGWEWLGMPCSAGFVFSRCTVRFQPFGRFFPQGLPLPAAPFPQQEFLTRGRVLLSACGRLEKRSSLFFPPKSDSGSLSRPAWERAGALAAPGGGRVPRWPVVRLLPRWAISSAAAGAPAPAALIEVQTFGGRFT